MKSFNISMAAIAALSLAQSAFATESMVCDKSIDVTFTTDYAVTNLSLNLPGEAGSFANLAVPGTVAPVRLACTVPAIGTGPHGMADQISPVAFCDDGIADGGYSVNVTAGGFAGLTIAKVVAKNFVQNKTVAELICQSVPQPLPTPMPSPEPMPTPEPTPVL